MGRETRTKKTTPRDAIEPRDSWRIRSENLSRPVFSCRSLPEARRRVEHRREIVDADSYLSQALLPQLFEGLLRLLQIAESHAVQHVLRLGELDLGVLDHLPAVAPRVAKV